MAPIPVQVPFGDLKLSAHLYLPNTASPSGAAIVIVHPQVSIKEQSPALYAAYLSARGFTCLTFDTATQGESEGLPRNVEDPHRRVNEIKYCISYLTLLSSNRKVSPHNTPVSISRDKIGVLGICAAGGYVMAAAQTDTRVKAVAAVSGVDLGMATREGIQKDMRPEMLSGMLKLASQDRDHEALHGVPGEEMRLLPERMEDATEDMPALSKESVTYYRNPARGLHPRAEQKLLPRSFDMLAGFDGYGRMEMISPRAVMFIAGSEAVTRWFSEWGYERAKEPKRLEVLGGKTHVQLYDDVEEAGDLLSDYFGMYLA